MFASFDVRQADLSALECLKMHLQSWPRLLCVDYMRRLAINTAAQKGIRLMLRAQVLEETGWGGWEVKEDRYLGTSCAHPEGLS